MAGVWGPVTAMEHQETEEQVVVVLAGQDRRRAQEVVAGWVEDVRSQSNSVFALK